MEEGWISWDDVPTFLNDLKAMAHTLLRRESSAQSIQTTALVLSALRRQRRASQTWQEVRWADRSEFFRLTHRMMRHALIDHARVRKARRKRLPVEDLKVDVSLDDLPRAVEEQPERVDCLLRALEELEEQHPVLARVAQHAMYSNLSISEIARLQEANDRTVRDQYQRARAWLARRVRELGPELDWPA